MNLFFISHHIIRTVLSPAALLQQLIQRNVVVCISIILIASRSAPSRAPLRLDTNSPVAELEISGAPAIKINGPSHKNNDYCY